MYRAISTQNMYNNPNIRQYNNLYNIPVRGIHFGKSADNTVTRGNLINYPIHYFNKNIKQFQINGNSIKEIKFNNILTYNYLKEERVNNEIILTLLIEKHEVNQKIFFLDNIDYIDSKTNIRHYHDNLKELNETNTKLFINKKECKYTKYFIPYREGIYEIKLLIYIKMNDCSHMFYNFQNIISINISNFDTSNVTNMNKMFFNCSNLSTLSDISKWNINNVRSMNWMFFNCSKLSTLPDISYWNTNNVNDMTFIKQIGDGAFSKVYLTIRKGRREFFATKAINKSQLNETYFKEWKIAENEYKILKLLNHPNIIRLEELKNTNDYYFLVMEYMNGGTLFECLDNYKNKYSQGFPEYIVQFLMRQIIDAIKYIHSKNIIHHDIRLDNIMVNFDNAKAKFDLNMMEARIKIIDFGISSIIDTTFIDLGSYLNKDSIMMNYYTRDKNHYWAKSKEDILQLGIISYAMLFGEYALDIYILQELIKKIESGSYEFKINISKEYLSFLNAIFQSNLNAEELSRHPFLTKNINEFIKFYPEKDSYYMTTCPIFVNTNNIQNINIQWY